MAQAARSALWAASWALGIAAGVAAGAYLSAISGVGAPGVQSLDTSDLVRVPGLVGAGVFAVLFAIRMIVVAIAGRVRSARQPDDGGANDYRTHGD